MLQSKLLLNTKKEWPNEATIKSHGLLIKGGYIKQMASGIYTLMPLAKRVISKIENIIREEMENIDSQEILMPVVATRKLWEMSDRYTSIGSELLRFKDRNNTDMVLSMTHEEATVYSVLNEANSYQKYPFSVFQIQTKFRDEARPRAGLIRVREFTMKDAYSFHTSEESLDEEYKKYYDAYNRIFKRVGIEEVIAVKSDTGIMGGSEAHEYMLLCEAGEDKIVVCNECDYSANMEVAVTKKIEPFTTEEEKLEKIHTPDVKTIEELQEFTKLDEKQLGKAVVYTRLDDMSTIIVFIRADRQVNETKLRNLLKIDDEALIPKEAKSEDDIAYGSIGPVNLNLQEKYVVVYDKSLENEKSLVFGANEVDYHIKGVNLKRDLSTDIEFVDVSKVIESDYCPKCGKKALTISNGIEVGNIFKIGDKYTRSLKMTYLDENSKEHYPIMGCYGIGIGRLMASVLEARASKEKIAWPATIAPFNVHILAIDYNKNEIVTQKANDIYTTLKNNRFEVLLDDRNKSAGVKFKDADLVGIPIKIVVSPRNLDNGVYEVSILGNENKVLVNENELLEYVTNEYNKLMQKYI